MNLAVTGSTPVPHHHNCRLVTEARNVEHVSTKSPREAGVRGISRGLVVARELDAFLTDKDAVAQEIEQAVRRRAGELGLDVVSVGIRDVILPGDMKDLMNCVMEAKKAAEANLISRREETAAMRSQANTAKLLADNPTLMRLRELEVLEKIATAGNLNVVLGEKGLADRVVNLLEPFSRKPLVRAIGLGAFLITHLVSNTTSCPSWEFLPVTTSRAQTSQQ